MIRQRGVAWCALALGVTLPRLTHSGILWVEEAYPAAAASQMLQGLAPYQDFFFDKPPGSIFLYALWGARWGWIQRIAGAAFVFLCCLLIYRSGRQLWGEREGWLAAGLLAFHLTLYVPSSVMALAPDLIMVAPHLAALWLAWRGQWAASGFAAALAMLVNAKGVFVATACLLWAPLSAVTALAGALLFLIPGYWAQVWAWGMSYSIDTFVTNPWHEGFVRTLNWLSFHATAAAGVAAYFLLERKGRRWKMAIWLFLCAAGVAAGWRFSPRYYFLALPCVVLIGARGLALLPKRWMMTALLALLLIPALRFGPRYLELAWVGDGNWADTAMNRDSRHAGNLIKASAATNDTILVWGYRPDILVYTRLKLGAPFLDSQPLTGVLADRHLTTSNPTFPLLAAQNRKRLAELRPDWVIDGLGPYNPALAVSNYPDLARWLAQYEVAFRTQGTIAYRLRDAH